jgi:hypothetical protein
MMSARALFTLVVAVALVAVSVAWGGTGSSSEGSVRAACTADATKALVRAFVRGYDHGQVKAIDRMWAHAPRFQWFSAGPPGARVGQRAYDRSTLVEYFRSRARAKEQIRLTLLRAGYDPTRDIVNFSGKLVRSANGIRPRGPKDFKGAADCLSGRPLLIVWSM